MARSIWTGAVSFGLVTIPIRLVPAVREKDVHFAHLHEGQGADPGSS
jgi:DNA end-binding protein Ku